MSEIDRFVDAGNIKFKTVFRESKYHVIRDKDTTGLFGDITRLFYDAFAIGYHFKKQTPIGKNSINHVNLVSFDRDIATLMATLVSKRSPTIKDPKELWKEVEAFAEYGIQVLYEEWERKGALDIDAILEK